MIRDEEPLSFNCMYKNMQLLKLYANHAYVHTVTIIAQESF